MYGCNNSFRDIVSVVGISVSIGNIADKRNVIDADSTMKCTRILLVIAFPEMHLLYGVFPVNCF